MARRRHYRADHNPRGDFPCGFALGSIWHEQLAASLAVVMFFIGILGIVFLPREARQLANPQYVSVTHSLDTSNGQPAVSLFWAFAATGGTTGLATSSRHSPARRVTA